MTELQESQPDGVENARAQDKQQHRHAPDKIIDPAVDRFQNRHNLLHKNPPRQIFLYHTTFFPDVKENLLLAFFVEI